MKSRRTTIFLTVLAAFMLVGSLWFSLDTQASEAGNLRGEQPFGLAAPLPDLIVSRIEVLTMTATSLDYRVVVQNIGEAVADIDGENPTDPFDNVNFQGYLSQDDVLGGMDDRGGGGMFMTEPSELAPGEEYSYTMSIGIGGAYLFDYNYLFVEVDAIKYLDESDENNNISSTILPDGPDLIVENVEVLSINSTSVVYQFTVRNIGDGIADLDGPDPVGITDNVNFRGVLSIDTTMDNIDDKAVGGSYLYPPFDPIELYPGEAFTRSFSAGMGGADYQDFNFIFVEIDGIDNLGETDEDNNIGMSEIPRFLYLPLILR